jgi:hypothetical protein
VPLNACQHCRARITYPAIFCGPCIADHRLCEHAYECSQPGTHRPWNRALTGDSGGDTSLGDEAVGDVIEEHVIRFPTANAAAKAREHLAFIESHKYPFVFDMCGQPLYFHLEIDGTLRWGDAAQFRNFSRVEIFDSPGMAARRFARVDDCPCTHCAHLRASQGAG